MIISFIKVFLWYWSLHTSGLGGKRGGWLCSSVLQGKHPRILTPNITLSEQNGMWYEELVVCNYSSVGNMEGGDMYQEGEGCSLCEEGFACDEEFSALCTKS